MKSFRFALYLFNLVLFIFLENKKTANFYTTPLIQQKFIIFENLPREKVKLN